MRLASKLSGAGHLLRALSAAVAFVLAAVALSPVAMAQPKAADEVRATIEPTDLSAYKLAPGDVITIRVFGEEDLGKDKVRLSDAGTIPYPVLGEIKARGFTIGEIEREVTAGLKGRYLVNPQVSVHIEEYRPFYINGMVERPGGYPYQPGLTVLKASALAGGFKERASMSKIYVIRESDAAQRPQKAELGSPVYPGDTISVQDSFF